ncbi:MAG TPA: LysR substrate-binding domain-containing protein [Sphingomonas sp.]|nr:LysR substrate-binding domain-containing protein [Sphingomonas sp.]
MDLLALADFNLVARHGGFGRAARATGRPKATLSRRVSELEAALGVRLFERGARDLKLSEEGQALHARSAALLTELEETAAAIASGADRPRGTLRISAPLLFSQVAMGRIAAGFVRDYPEVRLEVTTDDRSVDMVEEGYDLVIRVNPRPDESLVGRAFLRDRLVVVAVPGLTPPMDGLAAPVVVRGAADPSDLWRLETAGRSQALVVEPVLSLSSMVMVRDAIRLGVGAGRLPLSLVSRDLAFGRLVRWGDADASETILWALYPSRRLLSARVSAFLGYLAKLFPSGSPEELARLIDGGDDTC